MNILVIPSWYPSPNAPGAGLFFLEQAELYARRFPNDSLGIVNWGQNDDRLLLAKSDLWALPSKFLKKNKIKPTDRLLADNIIELFRPTFTWSRKLLKGNIYGIIKSSKLAFHQFAHQFGKPDLIHAQVAHPGGYVAWQLAREFEIPFMITEHMGPFPFPSYQNKNDLSPWLKDPLQHSDLNLAVSTRLKEDLNKHGVTAKLFHNFLDDSFFSLGSGSSGKSKLKLVHIGRLAPEKRQKDLLESLSLLPDTLDFELTLIGEGPLRSDLEHAIDALDLKRHVFLKGALNKVEIRAVLQGADIMILSSSYESFSVAILEALACGKPVVATRCGGPEDMIQPINGLLANPMDPEDLADKILNMSTNLGHYNAEVIRNDFEERFGTAYALDKLNGIYQAVIDNYQAR